MPKTTAPSRILKKLPRGMDQLARDKKIDPAAIGVWFADEARVGQKNKVTRRWARRGSRPSAPHDQRTASTYIFGAICPKDGKGAALVLPRCNIAAMNLHLAEIATAVAPGAHAVLVLDEAVGTCPTNSSCRRTSPSSHCRPNAPNSIRSRTFGSSSATTGSPTACSAPTATSSNTAALRRPAMDDYVDRPARLGASFLINGTWSRSGETAQAAALTNRKGSLRLWSRRNRAAARSIDRGDGDRIARLGKRAAQPFAGLVHRGAGFIDNADPKHEAVIDAVIAGQGRGYAGRPQLFGVVFALIAQRVVLRSDDKRRRQAGQIRGAERGGMRMCGFRWAAQIMIPEPPHRVAGQPVAFRVLLVGASARHVVVRHRVEQQLTA